MSKSKKMCCECINWEMGDTWQTTVPSGDWKVNHEFNGVKE